jgi:UDP-N-acetylmuramate dehydrogenase
VREVVVFNHAKKIRFNLDNQPPSVWIESGVNLGALARRAATKGLGGLEWAGGIPGTIGSAIYGNAGAHGSDMSTNLVMAKILHRYPKNGESQHDILQEEWSVDRFEYGYRSSGVDRLATW